MGGFVCLFVYHIYYQQRQALSGQKFGGTEGAWPQYTGNIAKEISTPIRAGLLLKLDHNKLVDLIASLSPMWNEQSSRDNAELYIKEISRYGKEQLANNCFWGNDTSVRINKERYKHPTKKRKPNPLTNNINAITTKKDSSENKTNLQIVTRVSTSTEEEDIYDIPDKAIYETRAYQCLTLL